MQTSPQFLSPILQALQCLPQRVSSDQTAATSLSSSFCAEGRLALDALAVEVHGLGQLSHPVASEVAQALHVASTPARYGHREATLLDTEVRDTGEIGAEALTLHWTTSALPALQAEVAQALGLHRLEVRLHNLLVYGPGQFFKPHQDTEKHAGMVATLVLVLPSAHIGGELRVWHGNKEAGFASQHLQADAIRWFAFYADCRHEILPVTEGWRIVLNFDLVVPPEPASTREQASPPLLEALREHFHSENGPSLHPWVFLLDHEYTEHGLCWSLLKGEDRPRVAALRAAAEELGLTVHLALAEIREQWSATLPYRGRHSIGEPEPDELIDDEMVLDFWVDADDQPLRRAPLRVAPDEADSFTDTDESFLVGEEYEGYMGNYGETLDYWYRRAALVIQTALAAKASRFATDFDAALADALALARQGSSEQLAQRLQAAASALEAQRHTRGRSLLDAYAELAAALPNAEQAQTLCEGFVWADFLPDDAPALARLAVCRGTAWLQARIQAWAQPAMPWHSIGWRVHDKNGIAPWPQALAPFIQNCQNAGLDATLTDTMLDQCLAALNTADTVLASQAPAQRHASLDRRLQALCGLAQALLLSAQAARYLAALLSHVQAYPSLYPLRSLRPLLQALPANAAAQPAVRAVHAAVVHALHQALALPEQSAADHRLGEIEWVCRCADCSHVIRWAESSGTEPLTLALAEARRRHVQSQLQAAAVPVGIETLKQGSPYKLIIRKPENLAAMRRALRQTWLDDLAALEKRSTS